MTPHSKDQLMTAERVSFALHHSHEGKATLMGCLERPSARGYKHVVVTPEEIRSMPRGTYERRIAPRLQTLSVSDEWVQRLWDAYQDDGRKACEVMQDLHDADVGEVVA